jgi:hypothetical protein
LSNGTISFGSIRLQTDDAGKQFPFMDRAVNRLNSIEIAGVIREISKHIANRTVKRHNTQILTAMNSPKEIVPFDNTWSFSGSNRFKSPLTVIEVEPI